MIELAAAMMMGFATVIDGDTIDIYGERFRLWGIQAPELNTKDGKKAKAFLERKILELGSIVECHDKGVWEGKVSPVYRIVPRVAQCWALDEDLAALLVCGGHAKDWRTYSGGYYMKISCEVTYDD